MRILFVFELVRFTLENIFLTSGMESEWNLVNQL